MSDKQKSDEDIKPNTSSDEKGLKGNLFNRIQKQISIYSL